LQAAHLKKHIREATQTALTETELAREMAREARLTGWENKKKALADFVLSWQFVVLIAVVGAPVVYFGQAHQHDKVDRIAVEEGRIPASSIK
jgi:hypothetical protein